MVHHHVHVIKGAFTLEIPLNGVKEERLVRHAVPEKDLLLLLSPDASVLEEEFKELGLGFLQDSLTPGLQVTQIREDAFFKLLAVEDRTTGLSESEDEDLDNVRAGDEELSVPVDAGDGFTVGERVGTDRRIVGLGPELRGRRKEPFKVFSFSCCGNVKGCRCRSIITSELLLLLLHLLLHLVRVIHFLVVFDAVVANEL